MKRPVPFLLIMLTLVLTALAPMAVAAQGNYPDASGQALFDYVTKTNDYTTWGTWPDDALKGYLDSGAPHGGVVRIFVNDVALTEATNFDGALPANSIIVKENFTGSAPAEPGMLDALTVMYKVDGYAPESGDWFWLKAKPDGTIDAEGKVAGCIGCHGGVEGHKDYVLRYGFGGEPAVASADQLAQQTQAPQTLPATGETRNATNTLALLIALGLFFMGAAFWLRSVGRPAQ